MEMLICETRELVNVAKKHLPKQEIMIRLKRSFFYLFTLCFKFTLM